MISHRYDLKKLLLRYLIVSCAGVLVLMVVKYFILQESLLKDSLYYFYIIICFNFAAEGIVLADALFNRRVPWIKNFRKRLYIQMMFAFLWTLLIGSSFYLIAGSVITEQQEGIRGFLFAAISGIVMILILNIILIIKEFIHHWKESLLFQERLKQEKLEADYQTLQGQLNPHFLFNSLNVLVSEIRYNSERAVEYSEKLADMYRYVLRSRDLKTVSLKTETEALQTYIFLQKVRSGEALNIETDIDPDLLDMDIPPLTLQILFENAVKHNVISVARPLNVKLTAADNYVEVMNNLQIKKTTPSTGIGLENIRKRYKILSDKNIEVYKSDTFFRVRVPLLGE